MSLRESAWIFNGCSGGGLALGVLAATKGSLNFKDPSGRKVSFSYIAGGLGIGAKAMPKAGGTIAPSEYWSAGRLYMLPGFQEKELTADDITGMCEFIEGGISLGGGASASVMHLGYDSKIVGNYKASLFLASQNSGLGASINYYLGSLGLSKTSLADPIGVWEVRANGEIFYYRFKTFNVVQWSYDRNVSAVKGEGNWQMKSHNMRIDWNSGGCEEWDLPLYSSGQAGIWYTQGAEKVEGMAYQGVKGQSYQINARRVSGVHQSSELCSDESMATCD